MDSSRKLPADLAAQIHSTNCFLNSLLREWSGAKIDAQGLRLPLSGDRELRVSLKTFSSLGRHEFALPALLWDRGVVRERTFTELARDVVGAVENKLAGTTVASRDFLRRARQSEETIRASLAARSGELDELYGSSTVESPKPRLDFLAAEQALVVGHSFHPTPKSRDEFDAGDLATYSPEFGGKFPIKWWLVRPALLHSVSAESFRNPDWLLEIARAEVTDGEALERGLREGYVPFPVHPWQRPRLAMIPVIDRALANDDIRDIGPGRHDWHPTSSVRSLYRESSEMMLKFSMSVRLTNSVRHLLVHEVARGLQLHDVLATEKGREFSARHPNFRVLGEPTYLALRDTDGTPLPETIVVARENPFRGESHSESRRAWAVLATLAQSAPYGEGSALIGRFADEYASHSGESPAQARHRWLAAYLANVVEPLLDAQANYGIVLGAHQQNLILEIEKGLPRASVFRDCQGTGYTELGFANFSTSVSSIDRANGNVVSERMGNALFIYYLFINSTLNVVAALAETGEVTEAELLDEVRRFLVDFRKRGVKDSTALDTLLDSPTLLHKGNFLCSVRGLNENTTADPLAIYTPIENPLVRKDTNSTHVLTVASGTRIFAPEVTYRPLAATESYRAGYDGKTIEVRSEKGLDFQAEVVADGGTVYVRRARETDATGWSRKVALEYLFGHFPGIERVAEEGTVDRGISRGDFFQAPDLWLARRPSAALHDSSTGMWTNAGDRRHPVRPVQTDGTLYRRYSPEIGATIAFRRVEVARDLERFHAWHNQPRVADLWDLAHSKEMLATYLEKARADAHQIPLILEIGGEAAGYFEIYWTAEDRLAPYYSGDPYDRGFHFLIGERKFLGFERTDAVLRTISHFLFLDEPRTRRIMAEPRADNTRVLRYVQTLPGWRFLHEFDFPHKRAALLECRREVYFEERPL